MIIDIHTHITCERFPEYVQGLERNPFDAKILVKRMDMEGIDKSVVLPLSNPENEGYFGVASTRETITACRKYPDRLIPFCNIDPRNMLNTPNADLSRLMRAAKDAGCRGIGEICANIPITDPRYMNLFAHAEKEKMPMIFHFAKRKGGLYGAIDKLGLPGLATALKTFPKAIFIGHSPSFWNEIDGNLKPKDREAYPKGCITKQGALWKLFANNPNLYGDMSAGSGFNALSRDPKVGFKFIRKFHKQLCFGTDRFTSADEPIPPLLPYMKAALAGKKLTKTQYDNIMYRNCQRLLG